MNNHFTVTIHDDNGVKQFNVHKFIKKAFLYAALFLLTIILIAAGTILYLNANVDKLQSKKNEVAQAYEKMLRQNKTLQASMANTVKALGAKEKELDLKPKTVTPAQIKVIHTLISKLELDEVSKGKLYKYFGHGELDRT